jgi:hypothetical protein
MRTAGVVLLAACCSLAAAGAVAGVQAAPEAAAAQTPGTDTCIAPVERPADARTVVAAQGLRVVGDRYEKRPARVSAYDREARPVWSHDLGDRGRFLARSVRVTDRGVLVVSRESDHSVVELLGEDRRPVWALRFGVGAGPRADVDARDALLESGGLLVADRERLLRYDRGTDRVVETWPLPDDAFVDEESRVTGVAPAGEGYLVTVAGNGTGSLLSVGDGGVRWRVDGLAEPHSPQALGGTVLLAEMAADRVVEVDREGEVVWGLTGLDRPRSAERLPGGTTLVADRRAHRVLQVAADGRVVWTAFAPWEPVDATRPVAGDRPAAAALNVSGTVPVDAANASYDELEACEAGLAALGANRSERAHAAAESGSRLVGAALVLAVLAGVVLAVRVRG